LHSQNDFQRDMSLIIEHLSKVYGAQRAVDDISFEAKPGEILGFLGPNGAGKTTTMKVVTTYIPPTEGKVTVCGFDTVTQSMDVRRQIGYLPEHNPLYKDMYVHEYLRFIARVRQISDWRNAIDHAIDQTGLEREQGKLIRELSKGYRQRVGLAQAILHNPKVLILDEPTSGLDPNQLVEIRELIKRLGRDKTVVFSSHILAEVEQLCDRVVIINQGHIVADDTLETLRVRARQQQENVILVEFDQAIDLNLLKKLPGVRTVSQSSAGRYRMTADAGQDPRAAISQLAQSQQRAILEIRLEQQSTEDIFRLVTQTPTTNP
jgi:ABC-2 type transport system ATP-binding protein